MGTALLNLLIFFLIGIKYSICAPRLVCYYTNWAQYRAGNGKFSPENLDPYLCDVIIYAFGDLKNNILSTLEFNDDSMISSVVALKKINTNLKVLLAVGGWNAGSTKFSNMVINQATRQQFVKSVVPFLKARNLDGLDLDWEYPTVGYGSRVQDKQLFTILLSELKTEFIPYNLILTSAVSASISAISSAYEIPNIAQYLDWINIMAYDFNGPWNSYTGFNAPLYARNDENVYQRNFNFDSAVRYWIDNGFPRSKIVVGMASYGRSFTLASQDSYKPGSPSVGPGKSGAYLQTDGFVAYYEVCELARNGWASDWDLQQMTPYIYKGNQWIGYDNTISLALKADYVKKQGLAGAMFWTLDLDDFNGLFCNRGKYPLIMTVKQVFLSGSTSTTTLPPTSTATTTATTTTTTTTTSTTTSAQATVSTSSISTTPSSVTYCSKGDGLYGERSTGCRIYYLCLGLKITNLYICPDNLYFREDIYKCDLKQNVVCQ